MMAKIISKNHVILLALLLLMLFTAGLALKTELLSVNAPSDAGAPCIVIDPGHGGVDSGALSIDGTRESDINLYIALKLEAIADFCGIDTIMTRREDCSSAKMQSYSEHQDLKHRISIANAADNAVLISIHQNCYPTTQPSGAQVLYANNDSSKLLGNIMQTNLVSCLDPLNRRLAEPANAKLYLTAKAQCPSVLVECGFMSNFSDIEKLKDNEYQKSVALVLAASYLQYCEGVHG